MASGSGFSVSQRWYTSASLYAQASDRAAHPVGANHRHLQALPHTSARLARLPDSPDVGGLASLDLPLPARQLSPDSSSCGASLVGGFGRSLAQAARVRASSSELKGGAQIPPDVSSWRVTSRKMCTPPRCPLQGSNVTLGKRDFPTRWNPHSTTPKPSKEHKNAQQVQVWKKRALEFLVRVPSLAPLVGEVLDAVHAGAGRLRKRCRVDLHQHPHARAMGRRADVPDVLLGHFPHPVDPLFRSTPVAQSKLCTASA